MRKSVTLLLAILFAASASAQWQPISSLKPSKVPDYQPGGPTAPKLKTGSRTDLPRKIEWFDWVDSVWVAEKTVAATYTATGGIATELWDLVQGYDLRYVYSYDNQDRETMMVEQIIIPGGWKDSTRHRMEWDNHDNWTLEVSERNVDGQWLIDWGYRYDHEYDGDLQMRETELSYSDTAGDYVPEWRYNFFYENGVMVSQISEEYNNGQWDTVYRTRQISNAQGLPDTVYYDTKNGSRWAHDGFEKYDYLANSGWIITAYRYDTLSSTYVLDSRWVEEFDSRNNLTYFAWDLWNEDSWMTLFGMRFTLAYEGGHAVSRISEYMDFNWLTGEPGVWTNDARELYSDFANLGTDPLPVRSFSISSFPNPAGSQASVRVLTPVAGEVVLTLFSMNGQRVTSQKVSCDGHDSLHTLNLEGVRPGTYLLSASDKSGNTLGITRLIKK